jgi:hypothetical protein
MGCGVGDPPNAKTFIKKKKKKKFSVKRDQREGMGLLEYQAMPSLRDVAYCMAVFCVHLVIDQPQTRAIGVVRQGRAAWDRSSHTKSHPAG